MLNETTPGTDPAQNNRSCETNTSTDPAQNNRSGEIPTGKDPAQYRIIDHVKQPQVHILHNIK
jgi:hypothetical protein